MCIEWEICIDICTSLPWSDVDPVRWHPTVSTMRPPPLQMQSTLSPATEVPYKHPKLKNYTNYHWRDCLPNCTTYTSVRLLTRHLTRVTFFSSKSAYVEVDPPFTRKRFNNIGQFHTRNVNPLDDYATCKLLCTLFPISRKCQHALEWIRIYEFHYPWSDKRHSCPSLHCTVYTTVYTPSSSVLPASYFPSVRWHLEASFNFHHPSGYDVMRQRCWRHFEKSYPLLTTSQGRWEKTQAGWESRARNKTQ